MTRVVPIFKSGDDSDPNNYRPISPLIFCKRIFEKKHVQTSEVVFWGKWSFLWVTELFREKHSTQRSIIDIVNRIQNKKDKEMFSCEIFIDLKKVFDTVDHASLFYAS